MAVPADINEFSADSHDPLPTGWRVPVVLLALAGPIIATMISRTAMNFIDFVMVSQLGTEAQAAIVPAGVTLFILIAFGMGVLQATSTFVSQSLGRREYAACSSFAWQGVWLSIFLGGIALPLWPLVRPFFAWVGHDPGVVAMETDYFQIGLISIGPVLVATALGSFFQGIHRPMIGLWATVIANIFNVIANYALIFGHFGFPALGIAGAAWATTVASLVQAIVMVLWWLRPRCHEEFASRSTWRINWDRLWRTLRVGMPMGFHFVTDVTAFTIFTLFLVGQFGTVQLAAHNLALKLLEISFMPVLGLGFAITAAVGKAIGRGRRDYARLVSRWALGIAITYMGTMAVCFVIFRETMPTWLVDLSDPAAEEVIRWSALLLLCCAAFQLFDAANIVYSSALRGAGDTMFPAIVSVTLSLGLLVGGGFAIAGLRPDLGALGPWLLATLYVIVVGLFMIARWVWGPWEKIDLFADQAMDI